MTLDAGVTPETQVPRVPGDVVDIIVSNLIGNALRHSPDRNVHVRIDGPLLRITNALWPTEHEDDSPVTGALDGFGLGLMLVRRLTDLAGWTFTSGERDGRYEARVRFSSH